jgi:hypothetical protein
MWFSGRGRVGLEQIEAGFVQNYAPGFAMRNLHLDQVRATMVTATAAATATAPAPAPGGLDIHGR